MHPPEWRARAKELWELGWNPKQVIDRLEDELGHRLHYRTLKDWADRGDWKYHVDHDILKYLNPDFAAGVSGIADPIYHLSLVLGKRLVREDSATCSTTDTDRCSRPSSIVARALVEVDREYDPGPHTLNYLKPVLMRYVNTIKRAYGRGDRHNEDSRRNRRSQEILSEFQAQGFEIDEEHASLDLVYTSQEEPEVPNDSGGTLEDIVHGTGGQIVRIVKAPGMPQGEQPPSK